MENKVLLDTKSTYLLRVIRGDYNPFTPNRVIITDDYVEFRRRNWHLVSVDKKKYHFKSFAGLNLDKHVFGADLVVEGYGHSEIAARGFTKKKAEEIYALVSEKLSKYSTTKNYYVRQTMPETSTADEIKKLKALLDDGTLTPEQYEKQKNKLLGN